jgi:hypothetical protein
LVPQINNPAPAPLLELSTAQREQLSHWLAWWEESEDRYRNWERRDRDEEISESFQAILRESDFASGRDLTPVQLNQLFLLARRLAPNPNLDARLYSGAGEPVAFNRLLRNLLYGPQPLAERLAAFLHRKGVGVQAATQLLCLAFPSCYPILSADTRAALKALEFTSEQLSAARDHVVVEKGRMSKLARDLFLLKVIQRETALPTYLELHRMLQLAPREAPTGYGNNSQAVFHSAAPHVVRERPSLYRPLPAVPETTVNEADLLSEWETFVATQGFTYPPLALRNYYVALKTRPFVILSGVSGTGKTRLTHLFAEFLTGNTDQQYRLLPVRPDWTDSTPLFGYHNILAGPEGRYVSTRFLDILQEAGRPENAHKAYFVCLDEMNLARVEYYFSDFLSAMEAPDREIHLQGAHGGTGIPIPVNFFVSGTVNSDETTHAFSRKVLDRANTIEFNEVYLAEFGRGFVSPGRSGIQVSIPCSRQFQSLFLASRVTDVALARGRLQGIDSALPDRILSLLVGLNQALALSQLSFGYRVRDELLRYLANSFDDRGTGLFDPNATRNALIALDFQILQKILPRLSGTQEQVEDAVRALVVQLLPASEPHLADASSNLRLLKRMAEVGEYPRSSRKLILLLAQCQRDGYCSFYES